MKLLGVNAYYFERPINGTMAGNALEIKINQMIIAERSKKGRGLEKKS